MFMRLQVTVSLLILQFKQKEREFTHTTRPGLKNRQAKSSKALAIWHHYFQFMSITKG